MKKQTIEIEVPDGKKAIWKDNTIKFVSEEPYYWKKITTFEDAYSYVWNNLPECHNLIESFNKTISDSYEHSVVCYRIVIAALTNNEKRDFVMGERWYPIIAYCSSHGKWFSNGKKIIGTIESKKERFTVYADKSFHASCDGIPTGLGGFASCEGVSCCNMNIGFRSVESKAIADHISTYFGKLLFDIQYRGINCDWRWVD